MTNMVNDPVLRIATKPFLMPKNPKDNESKYGFDDIKDRHSHLKIKIL